MDLMCMSSTEVGFMITAYYMGFTLGGLCFTLPDIYGRKKSLIFGLLLATISQTVMLLSHNYWVRYAMFGLSGLSQIKNSVSYVWLSESTSSPYKARTFTAINIFDALPMVVTCLYFQYVSKNWMHLSFLFCVVSYIALIAAFFCPESPRWLLINGESEQAIKALNQFSRLNGSVTKIPTDAVFVEDPSNVHALIENCERKSHLGSNQRGEEDASQGLVTIDVNLDPRLLEMSPVKATETPLLGRARQLAIDVESVDQTTQKLNISHLGAEIDLQDKLSLRALRKLSLDLRKKRTLSILDLSRQALNWR